MADIHKLEAQLGRALSSLDESKLLTANRRIIRNFVDDGLARGLSNARVLKYLTVMRKAGELLEKDFEKVTKDDIQQIVRKIETSSYAEWTKHDFKAVLKTFYKWLRNFEYGFPPEVRWIRTTFKGGKNSKLPDELLSETDILKMLDAARHPRDKAFVHVLYESACRVGELLTLGIKHVQFDKFGAQIIVSGKTGMRRVRLVSSVPSLAAWLSSHPFRDDPSAPLWTSLATNGGYAPLGYAGSVQLVRNVAKGAGVKKRIHPHLFRHSRLTELAKAGVGESILKEFAGWAPGSEQPAIYIHLSGKNVDAALLRLNGIQDDETRVESRLRPKDCARCRTSNAANSKFCSGCGGALDVVTALDVDRKIHQALEVEQKLDVARLQGEIEEIQTQLLALRRRGSLTSKSNSAVVS